MAPISCSRSAVPLSTANWVLVSVRASKLTPILCRPDYGCLISHSVGAPSGERKVRLEVNAVAKALRWLEGADAATRMRWQAPVEELGVTVPRGGIARENLPKWGVSNYQIDL